VLYDPVRGLQRETWHVRAAGGADAALQTVRLAARDAEDLSDVQLLRVMGVPLVGAREGGGGAALETVVRQDAGPPVKIAGSKSKLVVTYGAGTPAEVRPAFERSLRTWSNAFPSSVTIRIRFEWKEIEGGTLAATTTPFFISGNSDNADKLADDTMYGSVVAAALQGRDFLTPEESHFIMTFNSRAGWHYGEEASPFDKWDLATTALHEQCHGLFFSGVIQASTEQRVAGFSSGNGQPARFDRFLAASSAAGVASVCASNGGNFFNAITNDGLRFTDPATPGTDFSMYSPLNYQPGSSTYHHDPDRLQADCANNQISSGDCSDLMTHKLPNGYTQRSIGVPVARMLAAMLGDNAGVAGSGSCNVPAGTASAEAKGGASADGTSGGVFDAGFAVPKWAIYAMGGVASLGLIALVYALFSSLAGRRG
jgi:hypothetical protein